jgi:hypothetical protein
MSNVVENKREHPSYGLIQIMRTQGRTRLFGSVLGEHMNTVRIRVSHASEYDRKDGETGYLEEGTVVEIEMSPAQFAEAITTMNIYPGVPCTIRRLGHERVSDVPETETRANAMRNAVDERAAKTKALLTGLGAKLRKVVADSRLTKEQKAAFVEPVDEFLREATANLPWMITRVQEEMEGVVSAAKIEVDAALARIVHLAGVHALQGKVDEHGQPLLLTEGVDGERR